MRTLIVSGFPSDIRDEDIECRFRKYGKIESFINLGHGYSFECNSERKRSCFVFFKYENDANEALHALNGQRIAGRPILVEWAHQKRVR